MKIISVKNTQKGFTLIELLLYIGIASIMLLVTSVFLSTLLQSRVKNQTIAEVEQQGAQVMQIITQSIRNAENINFPSQGASASLLSLDVFNSSDDPTVFDISGESVRATEGVLPAVFLTNSRITASDLIFQNLSRDNTPGIIRIQFTFTHINTEGRNEYDYQKTFYTSASLR